jgi:anti-sigma B factor antagonist
VIVVHLELTGDLDLRSAPLLDAAVDTALEAHPTQVVLDASRTDFLDSTGLRAIVRGAERVRAARARFRLSGASATVRRVLEVADLLEAYRNG